MLRLRAILRGLAVPAALLVVSSRADAQQSSELRVRVLDELGAPAESAAVWIDLTRSALTDKDGIVTLKNVTAGRRLVRVRKDGYRTESVLREIHSGTKLELAFALTRITDVIQLAPLTVEAERRARGLVERGFYDRRKSGFGTFMDRDQLERYDNFTDLLPVMRQLRGFYVRPVGASGYQVVSSRGAISLQRSGCTPQFVVDGMKWPHDMVLGLSPYDVEAVEAYSGTMTAPPQYTWGPTPCGAILIWLRRSY